MRTLSKPIDAEDVQGALRMGENLDLDRPAWRRNCDFFISDSGPDDVEATRFLRAGRAADFSESAGPRFESLCAHQLNQVLSSVEGPLIR